MPYTGLVIKDTVKISAIYSIFWRHYSNTYRFLGETHNFWECVLVRKGEICVSADERIYHLQENEIIFHKPMELHKFHINNSDGVKVLIFSFFAEGKQMDFFRNKVFRLLNSQKSIIDNMLDFIHTKIDDFEMPDKIRNSTEKYLYPFKISGTLRGQQYFLGFGHSRCGCFHERRQIYAKQH